MYVDIFYMDKVVSPSFISVGSFARPLIFLIRRLPRKQREEAKRIAQGMKNEESEEKVELRDETTPFPKFFLFFF